MRYICNQKGGVWIQNRGPEQEIPAVTRVRLIAQKYQYWHLFHKSYWKFHKSYWKLNWNWCFHSSAAGRIPSEEGNLDLLTTKLCLNYWTQPVHKKTTRKLRKSREFLATIFSIPVLLACLSCEFKALMAGVGALIDKDPLPHSGAQSVSRWLLWNSTGYGSCKYMC